MINPAIFEESETFQAIMQGNNTVRDAVPAVIKEFGSYSFTRSHVTSAVAELPKIRKRGVPQLDETVRQRIFDLIHAGVIEKTGEKRFGRDMYRAVSHASA